MITGALIFFAGLLVGALPLVAICIRALRDDEWDSSNVFNVLRVLAHLATHPSDFAYMHYVIRDAGGVLRAIYKPFVYISNDEFSEVVRTRRPKGALK